MRDLQVLAADGFWSHVAYIPQEQCKNYTSVGLAADIVRSYVKNNALVPAELPELIGRVHAEISERRHAEERLVRVDRPAPSAKSTVRPDYIVSLENGRRYKVLTRHLSALGLSPAAYKKKWNLPVDYPMVAPNYRKSRSRPATDKDSGRKERRPDGG